MSPELAGVLGSIATGLVVAIGKILVDLYKRKSETDLVRVRIEREDTQRHAKIKSEEREFQRRSELWFAEKLKELMDAATAEHARERAVWHMEREAWHTERVELTRQLEEIKNKLQDALEAYSWMPDLLRRLWLAVLALNHDGPPTDQELRDLQYVVGEARLRLHAHGNPHPEPA